MGKTGAARERGPFFHGPPCLNLASTVGVSRQTINAIESGKLDAILRSLSKLTGAFDLAIKDAFFPEWR